MKRRQELVCVIGTDGSGKTTISDEVVRRLRSQDENVSRVWLGSESILMAPVRMVLRWARRRTRSRSESVASEPAIDTQSEVAGKHRLVSRYPGLVPAYVWLVMLDYRLQLTIKRLRYRRTRLLIADRYLFDVVVNLAVTLGWSTAESVRFAQASLRGVRLPTIRFYVEVSPEVSMQRKDDIPDIEYLRVRVEHYRSIATAFGFIHLSGELPSEQLVDRVIREIQALRERPYVLYVHANNVDVGGADRVLVTLAARLRSVPERPIRDAVCLRLDTHAVRMHSALGTPVILGRFIRPRLTHGTLRLVGSVFAVIPSLIFFVRLFNRERPDLVHLNDLTEVIPLLAARIVRIPVVQHVRMIRDGRSSRMLARLVRRAASQIVCVSAATLRAFSEDSGGLATSRGIVIHDHAAPSFMEFDVSQRDWTARPTVAAIGRVEEWKGQHVFLDAIATLPAVLRSGTRFVVVGGPVPGREAYYEAISSRASALGIEMAGERHDMSELLQTVQVSVHASVSPDPFPGVVVEGLLSGAVVVAMNAGGVPELVADGTTGFLVEPNHPAALASVLAEVLKQSPEEREAMGARASEATRRLLDPERIDQSFAVAYDRMLLVARGRKPEEQP